MKNKYSFKLKGDGPIDYHIGLNYVRDKDGTLMTKPEKYIDISILYSNSPLFKHNLRSTLVVVWAYVDWMLWV